jgi:hypothetical protein
MPRLHVFADEAGTFDFRRGPNISDYFIVCTVVLPHCESANDLLALRREMGWNQEPLKDYFHAAVDAQAVRDKVFDLIRKHDFTVQATVMEKCKAMPSIRPDEARFYKHGWYNHFKWGMPSMLAGATEVHVTAASVGTKKKQMTFTDAIRDVLKQTEGRRRVRFNVWPCATDPCLQLADYCTWAIQRKWESGGKDIRSYDLIKDRIKYEFPLFRKGTRIYY